MGSTPDIPNAEISFVDQALERAHSFSMSSLENGGDVEVLPTTTNPESILTPVIDLKITPSTLSTITTSSSSNSAATSGSSSMDPSYNCPHPTQSTDHNSLSQQQRDSTPPLPLHQRTMGPAGAAIKPMACEMCNNYEIQLQEVQYREGVLHLQISTNEKSIKQLKEELKKEQKFRHDLEEKYNEEVKKTEHETRTLSQRVDEGQKTIIDLTAKFNNFEKKSNDLVQELINQAEHLKRELHRVTHDNEILLGKTLTRSQELLTETIDIPQDDMQWYCLKLREDLIQAMVSKEHIQDQLRSENIFLKDQLRGEQQSKEDLEESNAREIELLNTTLESKNLELQELRIRNDDTVKELDRLRASFNHLQTNSVSKLSELEAQCSELQAYKKKADAELQQLRNKVATLQGVLDDSEDVQRDFVKLSQNLQVQLEKIRSAENEVRWQHEDDVSECNSCKKVFHSKKEKNNCKHCGKIFCHECTSKTICSGPKQRTYRVCNVCHTLLDNQSACWFVNDTSQNVT